MPRHALAQAVQAAQVTTEDYAMSSVKLEPLTVVGVEGLLGTAALLLVLMPIVQARRSCHDLSCFAALASSFAVNIILGGGH